MKESGVLQTICDLFSRGDTTRRFLEAVSGRENSLKTAGLCGSSKHILLSLIPKDIPLLIVCEDSDRAEEALEDLTSILPSEEILYLCDPHATPYERRRPQTALLGAKIESLCALATGTRANRIVTTASALMRKVPSKELMARAILPLRKGEEISLGEVIVAMTYSGYRQTAVVTDCGEFSRRGGIVDIFSFGRKDPVRIELDGEIIRSMREFDVETQRSKGELEEASILPAMEMLLNPEIEERALSRALSKVEDEEKKALLKSLMGGDLFFDGMERLAGFYEQELSCALDYFPGNTIVFLDEARRVRDEAERLRGEIESSYEISRENFPVVSPPNELFLTPEELAQWIGKMRVVENETLKLKEAGLDEKIFAFQTSEQEPTGKAFDLLRAHIKELEAGGFTTFILSDTKEQAERLAEVLEDESYEPGVDFLSRGFTYPEAKLAVLTHRQILSYERRRTRRRKYGRGLSLEELGALDIGDYVVHVDHGIGIYRGMKRIKGTGYETDCVQIDYRDGDKLFVPVHQLDLVEKYKAEEGAIAALSKLGGKQWLKTKERAKRAIKDMAREIIETHALRKSMPGHAFLPDSLWQKELESSFIHEETPDQLVCVSEVKKDMESPRSMDRLVCGDVGYGKTEVAVRAAFKAVTGGKQVAVLVPTTVLAAQHYSTFSERLKGYPVTVEVLSRFRSKKDQTEILKNLKAGTVDIVIGTHKLIQKEVAFKDLGLIIVDEEQRFGVRHKERMKSFKKLADLLTLTATPIPRTLHMSLSGAMDISIINTPPKDRLPVKTEIAEFDEELIADALLDEAERGGQSFFVHNRVETIDAMTSLLRRRVPQLTFGVAHGQMEASRLERTMVEFLDRKYDVLVSTMIIESGLDIPSVNTLLVNRADTFGLSQLYQLRGRVGRSSEKAYAYFFVSGEKTLTREAARRLSAIEEFDELGSGFKLAMRDLEIRGAGNVLGPQQHGFMLSVGFDLYMKLLEEGVAEIKGIPLEKKLEPKIVTDLDVYLPEEYVSDGSQRISIYKRLAGTDTEDEVNSLLLELVDRFGPLPQATASLFELRSLRILAAKANVPFLSVRKEKVELELGKALAKSELKTFLDSIDFPIGFSSGVTMGIKAAKVEGNPCSFARKLLLALPVYGSVPGGAA
ncbi:MAG: transcription-repair coupling factor [Candidatus Eisenbacteria bacterium]|nr:transcription-repair coupling factor [Candidatus Eisenbacteria bacterium]